MNKTARITLIIAVISLLGLAIWSAATANRSDHSEDDYSSYPTFSVYVDEEDAGKDVPSGVHLAATPQIAGGIKDYIKGGDIETAEMIIFEYADYQCAGCATVNPWVNELLERYDGRVVVVYRGYQLGFSNGRVSAAAANAAGLQGYWKPMADLLFANQSEWAHSKSPTEYFVKYFKEASDNKGDINRFKADLGGDEVKSKIDFDMNLAFTIGLKATPSFYYNGELIDWFENNSKASFIQFFENYIDKILSK